MLTDISQRYCEFCDTKYRPRYPTQRWCRRWCRMQAKAAEGRAARRAWWRAGRPMDEVVADFIRYREEKQSELAALFAKPKPLARRRITLTKPTAETLRRVVVSSPT